MNTITCIKCGNVIEITQALEEQARKTIEEEVKTQSRQEGERIRKETRDAVIRELTEKQALEQEKRAAETEENRRQNRELREQLLELTKQLQSEKTKAENAELEMRKKLIEMQDKLYTDAKTKADDEHKLKIAELSKKLDDAAKANEDLQRKLSQGSQQLQGEVLELDLEQMLRTEFVFDRIEPIAKGVHGADIRQIVKTQRGNECGVILWEIKQQKAWKKEWIEKLKGDLRAENAHIPVIVTTALPEEAKSGLGTIDGVVVTTPQLAVTLAEIMRQKLIESAREKFVAQNREGKADELYGFITGHEFRQQVEAIVEVYQDMQLTITKERATMEKIWKTRETQVSKLFTSTARMVGSMRGIIGQSMPPIRQLDMPDDGDDTPSPIVAPQTAAAAATPAQTRLEIPQ